MDKLICVHCNAEIQRGKSFYKHLGEVFCCKKCFNDHLWGGRDEVYYCDEVVPFYIDPRRKEPVYLESYNDLYDYYLMLQTSRAIDE